MSNNLNPQQKQAVEHIGSPLLVLAGAGSGKTRVIITKISWLIRKAGMNAKNIAAITFTNKAAHEMRERVNDLLHKDESKGLTVSTFHTLGLNIIRREYKTLGYKSGFTILDAQDTGTIIKELALKEVDSDALDDNDNHRQVISRWKNDFVSAEKAYEMATTAQELLSAKVYKRYQRQLKAYNALDFDDLIVLPVQLFNDYPEILSKWQQKLRYLLVDEYQDTNTCQYNLIKQLVGMRSGLTVVGDDDQSIYAWRGARPENITQLSSDYPQLKVIKLEQNYRSTSRILESANQMIANNPHLYNKNLWSALGKGKRINILPCRTAEHEVEKVVSEIMKYVFCDRARYKDFAILYRSNHQSRLFEQALRNNDISYKITGGTSFFERTEVKDTLAYLRLISNSADDAAFLRVVNTPKRGIGASTLEKLGTYANKRNISLFIASTEMGFAEQISSRAKARLERFSYWVNEMMQLNQTLEPHEIVNKVIAETDYAEWLQHTSSSPKMAERRMQNVHEIVDWVKRLYDDGNDKETLADIVSHMTLMDILEHNKEDDKEQNDLSLMTLHSAKGLEFPYVFMVGVEEEILPHTNSIDDEKKLEEERRLAYVGITRAKKQLTISFAKTRKRYGEAIICDPSRFLEELPEEHIEWANRKVTSDKEMQETAQSYIANLQDLLES
jgi:ATP-dependent DNA helicase Rep